MPSRAVGAAHAALTRAPLPPLHLLVLVDGQQPADLVHGHIGRLLRDVLGRLQGVVETAQTLRLPVDLAAEHQLDPRNHVGLPTRHLVPIGVDRLQVPLQIRFHQPVEVHHRNMTLLRPRQLFRSPHRVDPVVEHHEHVRLGPSLARRQVQVVLEVHVQRVAHNFHKVPREVLEPRAAHIHFAGKDPQPPVHQVHILRPDMLRAAKPDRPRSRQQTTHRQRRQHPHHIHVLNVGQVMNLHRPRTTHRTRRTPTPRRTSSLLRPRMQHQRPIRPTAATVHHMRHPTLLNILPIVHLHRLVPRTPGLLQPLPQPRQVLPERLLARLVAAGHLKIRHGRETDDSLRKDLRDRVECRHPNNRQRREILRVRF